ncbi:MAG: uncharacterized protein JWQ72_979 [Polaromonas sp.]|nr:uncharacterized protein [Polaromonas sp.]
MSPLKQILADRSLAYYYAQKGVRIGPLRRALGACVAALVRQRAPLWPASAANTPVPRMVGDLEKTGFAALPEKSLGTESIASIRQQLARCPLRDYYGSSREYSLSDIPADVVKVRHDSRDVLACRGLMDLANDPDILAAVSRRLGARPTLSSAEAWWTFGENNAHAHRAFDDIYHRDADDLRFVKMFVYLTDTSLDSGAHRFVLGSHLDDLFIRRGAIADSDVESAYPAGRMLTVTGAAGTAFLEETWGIHRALLATQGRRLMFSAIYALGARMPFAPPKPLLPLPPGYDPYVNRLLFYPA